MKGDTNCIEGQYGDAEAGASSVWRGEGERGGVRKGGGMVKESWWTQHHEQGTDITSQCSGRLLETSTRVLVFREPRPSENSCKLSARWRQSSYLSHRQAHP